MGRRIVDERHFKNPTPKTSRRNPEAEFNSVKRDLKSEQVDSYFDRLVKYFPTDIVLAWVTVLGLIDGSTSTLQNTLLWIMLVLFTLITSVWTLKQTHTPGKPPAITQTIISTGAFFVFAFALGKPFETLSFYKPLYGSLLLTIYTTFVSLIIPPEG